MTNDELEKSKLNWNNSEYILHGMVHESGPYEMQLMMIIVIIDSSNDYLIHKYQTLQ